MSDRSAALIIPFRELTIDDVSLVGGKNAALGEMVANFLPLGIAVPDGFAVTAAAYNHFLDAAGRRPAIASMMAFRFEPRPEIRTPSFGAVEECGVVNLDVLHGGFARDDVADHQAVGLARVEQVFANCIDIVLARI